jgi:Putative transmembrane protein (PGPGW)
MHPAAPKNGSSSWTRTSDHSINSRMLYQLSYRGIFPPYSRGQGRGKEFLRLLSGACRWVINPHIGRSGNLEMQSVKIGRYRVRVPNHPVVRIILGLMLVIFGIFGFLPILGFWMIPFGLVILSVDFAWIRRWRRTASVKLGGWLSRRWPKLARSLGFGPLRDGKT